jgi:hypothetical protein
MDILQADTPGRRLESVTGNLWQRSIEGSIEIRLLQGIAAPEVATVQSLNPHHGTVDHAAQFLSEAAFTMLRQALLRFFWRKPSRISVLFVCGSNPLHGTQIGRYT